MLYFLDSKLINTPLYRVLLYHWLNIFPMAVIFSKLALFKVAPFMVTPLPMVPLEKFAPAMETPLPIDPLEKFAPAMETPLPMVPLVRVPVIAMLPFTSAVTIAPVGTGSLSPCFVATFIPPLVSSIYKFIALPSLIK